MKHGEVIVVQTTRKDVFDPYVDGDGNRREKPLYLPKYIKTVFKFSREHAIELAALIQSGEYHTVGNFVGASGESAEHAFLVLEIQPTGNADEYVLLSEDYGVIQ
jgi:hypothetical protein